MKKLRRLRSMPILLPSVLGSAGAVSPPMRRSSARSRRSLRGKYGISVPVLADDPSIRKYRRVLCAKMFGELSEDRFMIG